MAVERMSPVVGGGTLPDDPENPVDPSLTEMDDGTVEADFGSEDDEQDSTKDPAPDDHSANLAEVLPDAVVQRLGSKVVEAFDIDYSSTDGWRDQIVKGLEELGLRIEDTAQPFQGACGAVHPLLLENIVKFQSKAIQELIPAAGPVRTRLYGVVTEEREAQATRVKDFMNFQVMEEMVEFTDEFERLLFALGLVGTAVKKIYFDGALDRPVSEYVPIDDFVVSYNAPDLRRAERYTHVLHRTKDEFERDVAEGVYRDVSIGSPAQPEEKKVQEKIDRIQGLERPNDYEVYTLYEHHCYWKFDHDKFACPYVVTVDSGSSQVLSIRRNWRPEDAKKRRVEWFVRYLFVPGTGFFGFGLLHLIGSLAKTATEVMRSLVDSGQFANLQGGFKLRTMRIVGNIDDGAIAPGEWRDVDAPNMDIGKAIMPVPYKEPSQTLFALLQFVVAAGQKFADTTEQVIADSSNYGPVGTTMALLEASTKFFSSIHKRLHNSLKQELRILKRINRDYPRESYPYPVSGGNQEVKAQDFDDPVDVIPASDPNTPSNAHRVTRATTVMQMAQQNASLYDMRAVNRTVLLAMEVDNIDALMPPPVQPQPLDPLSDIMAASQAKPIAAFQGQDHDAHIQVKTSFLQDPQAGGSPAFQAQASIIAANIREHMVMKYQEAAMAAMQQQQQAQPQPGQGQPPDGQGGPQAQAQPDPNMLAKAQAQAAQQVSQISVQQAQQQAMQAQQADPAIQLGERELEQQTKEHSDDLTLRVAELATKNRELDIREQGDQAKNLIGGLKLHQQDTDSKRRAGLSLVDAAMKDLNADSQRRNKDK